LPATTRVRSTGWFVAAGPLTTEPSDSRNTLPCHGQTTQSSPPTCVTLPSPSGPVWWPQRSSIAVTMSLLSPPLRSPLVRSPLVRSPLLLLPLVRLRTASTGTSPSRTTAGSPSTSASNSHRSCQPSGIWRSIGSAWLTPAACR
jgi:hypothetical protein